MVHPSLLSLCVFVCEKGCAWWNPSFVSVSFHLIMGIFNFYVTFFLLFFFFWIILQWVMGVDYISVEYFLLPLTFTSRPVCVQPKCFVTLAAKVATQKLVFVAGDITMWCNFLMNVLAMFMVEEFYIYAVVQFFFFCRKKKCNV